jgi:phage shock protein PspC (stress-responsive transcriptional regulator)
MNTTTADARSATVTGQPGAGQLRRSGDERMLAGVAGGIARYLNADVTLVRVIIIAALALFTGAGAALYIAAWLLIPADGDDEPVAAAWLARRQHRSRQAPEPRTA